MEIISKLLFFNIEMEKTFSTNITLHKNALQLHDSTEMKSNQFEILLTFHNENSGNVNLAESYNQSKVLGYQSLHNQKISFMFQKHVIIMLILDINKYTVLHRSFQWNVK